MMKPIKAALLSGLIFPGLGHLYLGSRIRGALLATTALASLYVLISNAVVKALQITDRIQRGEIPMDPAEISRAVSAQSAVDQTSGLGTATVVLLVAWLIGIFDSYRVGRIQSRSRDTREQD